MLGARVRAYVAAVPPAASLPGTLAQAAAAALDEVARQAEGRGAALDLLAADALITLALLAQAEVDPARLHEFATTILRRELART